MSRSEFPVNVLAHDLPVRAVPSIGDDEMQFAAGRGEGGLSGGQRHGFMPDHVLVMLAGFCCAAASVLIAVLRHEAALGELPAEDGAERRGGLAGGIDARHSAGGELEELGPLPLLPRGAFQGSAEVGSAPPRRADAGAGTPHPLGVPASSPKEAAMTWRSPAGARRASGPPRRCRTYARPASERRPRCVSQSMR